MNKKKSIFKESVLCTLFFVCMLTSAVAQSAYTFTKINGDELSGRLALMSTDHTFGRLPATIKDAVRPAVWSLGENSAGVYIDFKTNADTIVVKYKVKGALNMPHMPTIGVSGVDLYYHNQAEHTSWSWSFGHYQFKDTIQYTFSNIGNNRAGTYRLFLPMYNSVEFMEIGVNKSYALTFVKEQTKPIIIYGTSIAQGACASRPGMAWTNILSRDFNNEIVNLAFSGNGRLEQPILDLMVSQDAAVYILDCIPNLSITSARSEAQLDSLLWNAVTFIRSKRPHVPIVLTAHSSAFTPGFLNKGTMYEYGTSTQVTQKSFEKMKKSGVKNIYYLSSKDLGLDVNSTVDYAHPNDWGMMKIAKAYTKILRKIIK